MTEAVGRPPVGPPAAGDREIWVSRSALGHLELLDRGGEGTVYRLRGGPAGRGLVFKEYRNDRRDDIDSETLSRFPRLVRSLDRTTASWLFQRAACPTWLVSGDGSSSSPVGLLMPEASARFNVELLRSSGGTRPALAKMELLLNGEEFLRRVGLHVGIRARLRLATSVAETMVFLHAQGIVVGDFSCKNVLFSLRPRPSCLFLDCDSMVWGGRRALPGGETPEWEVPTGEPFDTAASDAYKFGLLVLRLYTGAQHHRDPARLPAGVPVPLRNLVERTLDGPAARRPMISEWLEPLRLGAAAAPPGLGAPQLGPPGGSRAGPRPAGSRSARRGWSTTSGARAATSGARAAVGPTRAGRVAGAGSPAIPAPGGAWAATPGPISPAASPAGPGAGHWPRVAVSRYDRGWVVAPAAAAQVPAPRGRTPGPLLGSSVAGATVTAALRWLLVRQPARPTLARLATTVIAVWVGCALVFAVAFLVGLHPQHLDGAGEALLLSTFAVVAALGFALGTTEPR
jgi:hypothetical protein